MRRAALMVAGLAALAFVPSLASGFVYDDTLLIVENPYAHSLEHIRRALTTHLWDIYSYGSSGIGLRYYRPLVSASYVLNWVTSGGQAWAFHLVNVVAHAAATFLAVRIATRFTGSLALGVIAGLIFGLHPTRTESVVWIAGRTDVFMALFMLLAVELAHAASRHAGRRGFLLAACSVLATALAILSKEASALTALLVAVDWVLARQKAAERRRLGRIALVLGALGLGYVVFRSAFYPVRPASRLFDPTPAYGFMTIWAYVERIALPWPQTFFHRPVEAHAGLPAIPTYLIALGALAAAGYLALLALAWRRDRAAFVLLFAAALLIAPLLNFFYTGIFVTTSDHFLYLPLLLLASGVLRLFRERAAALAESRSIQLAFGGLLLVMMGVDALRAMDYRDDETFWQHERSVNPDNPVALAALGQLRARDGELEEADELLRQAQSPEKTRYFLLGGARPWTVAYVRRLGMQSALTADGDVRTLGLLYGELDAIVRGERGTEKGRVNDLAVGIEIAPTIHRELLSSESIPMSGEVAILGGRIGRDDRVRELLAAIPDDEVWRSSNALNLVLTHARIGDFAGARRRLELLARPPSGVGRASAEQLDDLRGRLDRAEKIVSAGFESEGSAAIARALAMAELGAYLRGLRVLRPVFERDPQARGVAPLYVQLLMAARLEQEATRVASEHLGPERGPQAVAEIRAQLPARVRSSRAPQEPSPWRDGARTSN